MNKLVVGNLLHRPIRTLITTLAVAIEVIMILSIVGIMIGQVAGSRTQRSGVGADLLVQPQNSSFISSIGGAPVPIKIADVLAKLPHVAVAAPVTTNLSTVGTIETITGINYQSYNALRPFVFLSGGPFTGPNDMIIDDLIAKSGKGYKVGDTIKAVGHSFRVCGIVEAGRGGRKFVPIHTLGALLGNPNNASFFYIRADRASNDKLIEQEITATPGLGQYKVQSIDEWLALMTPEHLPGFTPFLNSIISIAVIVGFLVIFQSMYTAVIERTREIGILKSLGANRVYIVNAILREAGLVTIAGVCVGVGLTLVIKLVLNYRYPTLPFIVPAHLSVVSLVIAFLGAILGASYPAWKAASKDPIEALAYE